MQIFETPAYFSQLLLQRRTSFYVFQFVKYLFAKHELNIWSIAFENKSGFSALMKQEIPHCKVLTVSFIIMLWHQNLKLKKVPDIFL